MTNSHRLSRWVSHTGRVTPHQTPQSRGCWNRCD